jgi:hypothetical protein
MSASEYDRVILASSSIATDENDFNLDLSSNPKGKKARLLSVHISRVITITKWNGYFSIIKNNVNSTNRLCATISPGFWSLKRLFQELNRKLSINITCFNSKTSGSYGSIVSIHSKDYFALDGYNSENNGWSVLGLYNPNYYDSNNMYYRMKGNNRIISPKISLNLNVMATFKGETLCWCNEDVGNYTFKIISHENGFSIDDRYDTIDKILLPSKETKLTFMKDGISMPLHGHEEDRIYLRIKIAITDPDSTNIVNTNSLYLMRQELNDIRIKMEEDHHDIMNKIQELRSLVKQRDV